MLIIIALLIIALIFAIAKNPIGDLIRWWVELLPTILNGGLACIAFIGLPATVCGLAYTLAYFLS